jgi:hypothetical protein
MKKLLLCASLAFINIALLSSTNENRLDAKKAKFKTIKENGLKKGQEIIDNRVLTTPEAIEHLKIREKMHSLNCWASHNNECNQLTQKYYDTEKAVYNTTAFTEEYVPEARKVAQAEIWLYGLNEMIHASKTFKSQRKSDYAPDFSSEKEAILHSLDRASEYPSLHDLRMSTADGECKAFLCDDVREEFKKEWRNFIEQNIQ